MQGSNNDTLEAMWDETNSILQPHSLSLNLTNTRIPQNVSGGYNTYNQGGEKRRAGIVRKNGNGRDSMFPDVSNKAAAVLRENPMYSQTMGQSILNNGYLYASSACFGQDDESVFKGRGTGGLTRKKDDICNQQKDNVTSVGGGDYRMNWDPYIPKQKCVAENSNYYHAASPILVDIDSKMKGLDQISSRCYDRFPITPQNQIIAPDQTICADARISSIGADRIRNVDRTMKLGYQLLR